MGFYDLIHSLVTSIASGGIGGIILVLCFFIGYVIYDRYQLMKRLDEQDDKIMDIIRDYNNGVISHVQAINSINLVLAEIKGKL